MYDVIIIGAGAAGTTAAIYAARRALKTLVISKDIGGQAALTSHIENYPGVDLTGGIDLMMKFKTQAEKFGAEFVFDQVNEVKKDADKFVVKTGHKEYESTAVILAFGLTPRDLGATGEEKFKGQGVSYCATCDGPLYKNKITAVVGGGNSALDAALLLAKIASHVYLIHRGDAFRGEEILINQVKANDKIEIIFNSEVKEVKGDKIIDSIIIKDKENTEREIKVNGIFVEIGHEVKADLIRNLVKLNEKNEIVINENCETSEPGIFAAGDVTDMEYKQIVISAGEGAKAALSAYSYIQKKSGKGAAGIDWGTKK
jgi:thioredoxin reductase (NADPH)